MADQIAVTVYTNLNIGSQVWNMVGKAKEVRAQLKQIVANFNHMNNGNDYSMVAAQVNTNLSNATAQAFVTVLSNAQAALEASSDFVLMCEAIIAQSQ